MATRNLTRTIIEGGRANWTKFARTSYNRRERHRVSQDLRSIEVENFDNWVHPIPRSVKLDLVQKDKLNPLWRYLDKFRGKPYNYLISSLLKEMDRRNIRAHHLLDHVEFYLGTYPKRSLFTSRYNKIPQKEDVEDGIITFSYQDSWKKRKRR